MQPAGVVAALAALLVSNGTSVLDCVCTHLIDDDDGFWSPGHAEYIIRFNYCRYSVMFPVFEDCRRPEQPSAASAAVGRLIARMWSDDPAGGQKAEAEAEAEGCGRALAELRSLTLPQENQLIEHIFCRIAADCIRSCPAPRSDWNVTALRADRVRRAALSQSVLAVRRITRAAIARTECETHHRLDFDFFGRRFLNKTELQDLTAVFREHLSNTWRDFANLFSLGVSHASQLLVPLAFEDTGNHTSDQRLHGWIKDVERVGDMLHTKLTGLVLDTQSIIKQVAHYEIEQDKPSLLKFRRPLLSPRLLLYQPWNVFFHDDFSALCEERQPESSHMFRVADALYSFYRVYWFTAADPLDTLFDLYFESMEEDEEWQLEDRSHTTVSVDTDCVQLLANALDHPTCPLEDLPPETVEQRERCRAELWDDVVQRSPHVPVTSYLAYTQRVNINLCLLAWMAVGPYGICQDVPFSTIRSVHDARCYFDSPDDQSCLESNATDAICSVSRAILMLRCRDFSAFSDNCSINYERPLSHPLTVESGDLPHQKVTEETLNHKNSLNDATLRYKNFKIDSLKPLEISLVLVNIVFRLWTAGVYMYLPQLRNLPGKIFLSFQITCIVQIMCSEVVYRMTGFPGLSTAVLIDSGLTLLSCIWLNLFCYHMYACVRHLTLPDDLLPAEVSRLLCRQVLYALIPWSTVCVAAAALEKTSKYHLIHSRVVVLASIALSVSFNMVCLGLIGYMYLRTRFSMRQLKIFVNNKFASKKQCFFMSVKAVILSGIGIIIRIGFHQAQEIAQFVYYVHLVTMLQGPVLFVCFVCNGTTLPLLKDRLLAWFNPTGIPAGRELCSAAERNLARRNNEQSPAAESSL
ncbi:uncharacterized protein LOC126418498 [Schistocerca serialis cubense]|uniref:uncharacterized protein LOC126418498 n=1 Tax=Schistocerca serialis cubense TaxID=2023355 RepID=UPI00214E184F|nr:uncharacterized protein LOC126418498 [Schistocerca serialis cubense]